MALLSLRNVSVGHGASRALDEVSLDIGPGERLAVIGPNGAGKTTLLKVIAGSLRPDGGQVIRSRCQPAREGETAFVWQGLHLVSRLSAFENTLIGAAWRCGSPLTWARVFPKSENERAMALLASVGIEHLAHERVDRLSGGERQRVAIARALMQDACLLLADEPTASLDFASAEDIVSLISRAALERGCATITVLHDMRLVEQSADRLLVLTQGRIVFDGAPSKLDR